MYEIKWSFGTSNAAHEELRRLWSRGALVVAMGPIVPLSSYFIKLFQISLKKGFCWFHALNNLPLSNLLLLYLFQQYYQVLLGVINSCCRTCCKLIFLRRPSSRKLFATIFLYRVLFLNEAKQIAFILKISEYCFKRRKTFQELGKSLEFRFTIFEVKSSLLPFKKSHGSAFSQLWKFLFPH